MAVYTVQDLVQALNLDVNDTRGVVQSQSSEDPVQVDLSESVRVRVSTHINVIVDRKLLHPAWLQRLLQDENKKIRSGGH